MVRFILVATQNSQQTGLKRLICSLKQVVIEERILILFEPELTFVKNRQCQCVVLSYVKETVLLGYFGV